MKAFLPWLCIRTPRPPSQHSRVWPQYCKISSLGDSHVQPRLRTAKEVENQKTTYAGMCFPSPSENPAGGRLAPALGSLPCIQEEGRLRTFEDLDQTPEEDFHIRDALLYFPL